MRFWGHTAKGRRNAYGEMRSGSVGRRAVSLLLCLCMLAAVLCNFGGFSPVFAAAGRSATDHVFDRIADADTMDDYLNRLLSEEFGTRYAGRIWTDKTVFAYGYGDGDNNIPLDWETDGYDGGVGFSADFAHVFSALASSQMVNEYPRSPIDLVIVFDMSASMGQDTRYGIDTGGNSTRQHSKDGDTMTDPDGNKYEWPQDGVSMEDRIKNSRIQQTLDAINRTIDNLMAQNPQNRVAVCAYGANATVLMPLAHYRRVDTDGNGSTDDNPYLSVGGMETLYHPSDLQVKTVDGKDEWRWMNNRDTCYTVAVHAEMNTCIGDFEDSETGENEWKKKEFTVSNNVYKPLKDGNGTTVKAFPGVETQTAETLRESAKTFKENSEKSVSKMHKSEELTAAVKDTKQLKADEYVGYFTNTQGGIYLAYKQLAQDAATTYTERLDDGRDSTVARIPAAIIMSDGGANFAFNQMGDAKPWGERFGSYTAAVDEEEEPKYDEKGDPKYTSDQDRTDTPSYTDKDFGVDNSHRLYDNTNNGLNQGKGNGNIGDEWYNVYLPGAETLDDEYGKGLPSLYNPGADIYQDGTLSSQPSWYHAGVLYSSDNHIPGTSGTVLEVLMTASFMNAAVKKHYEQGWEDGNAVKSTRIELSTYTMNVDSEHVPQWGRMRLYPTLDPKDYPLDALSTEPWYGDETKFGTDALNLGDKTKKDIYDGLYQSWDDWKNGKTAQANMHNANIKILIEPLEDGGYTARFGENAMTVTNQDVIDNIRYNNEFYDVTSSDLDSTFDTILSLITGQVFIPVSGDNAAGVGGSVTYQDPIGEYMEIKDGSITATPYHTGGNPTDAQQPTVYDMAMLLFGEMHGVVRTGVYDYQWNTKYEESQDGDFTLGWYRGDDPENAQKAALNESGLPESFTTAAEAWAAGWVMRLDYRTLTEYVPIVSSADSEEHLSDQAKNTVYTVYRFGCNEEERNKLRINPIYGDAVPKTLEELWEDTRKKASEGDETAKQQISDDRLYREYPGVYRLSDVRVWVEDTGDWVDEDGAITPENAGYSESLYLNIPVAAVPTQVAEITLGPAGVLSYKTNLDEKTQCTPVRLFYAVGLAEEILVRDSSGKSGVDIGKLSDEYIRAHTNEADGSIWFISNYYSNTLYEGYSTGDNDSYTRGDPTATFSPSAENRYYVFQKPLSIYAHAYRIVKTGDGSVTLSPVDRNDGDMEAWNDKTQGGNGKTTWETLGDTVQSPATWDGGLFLGVYQDLNDFKEKYAAAESDQTITDAHGASYLLGADNGVGGIVFLADDLLDHVRSKQDGGYESGSVSFDPDDYFFILLEYYLPDEGVGKDLKGDEVAGTTAGHAVQRVVTRRGSEFGSGLHSENIDNGDMLCWTDMNRHTGTEIDYLSRTDTGDNTRGEPTWEKLTKTGDALKQALRDCGIQEEAILAEQVEYWTQLQTQLHGMLMLADKDENNEISEEEFNAYFHFAVAARTGGLRVGDMFQNRLTKQGFGEANKIEDGNRNRTQTAYSYYIPTISSTSGVGNDIIINNYLGNNGRLSVVNQTLLVTKMLEAPGDFALTEEQKDKTFDYQVYLKGMTGVHTANRVLWNKYSETWQRRIASIDILTDNGGLLLDKSNQRALFDCGEKLADKDKDGNEAYSARLVVPVHVNGETKYYYASEDGTPTEEECEKTLEQLYYLYLPSNVTTEDAEDTNRLVRRIFNDETATDYEDYGKDPAGNLQFSGRTSYYAADSGYTDTPPTQGIRDVIRKATDDRPAGTHAYWALNAELIPCTEVFHAEGRELPGADSSGSGGIATASLKTIESSGHWSHASGTDANHRHMRSIDLVIDKPTGVTSEIDLITPYATRTMYAMVELRFGEITENDLYDPIIPAGDRADFAGLNNEQIAKNTASFTLRSGEGLLIPGLFADKMVYRFTEKLTEEDMRTGYRLKEVDHVQQYGSLIRYRPGQNRFTDLGTGNDGTNFEIVGDGEPFYHSNAKIVESYATFANGETGNHHDPEKNPACKDGGGADEKVSDTVTRHYFIKDGELVDKHHMGEDPAFNGNRYVVGATAHFLVNGETPDDAKTELPATPNTDYAGVYSVFGNTGTFEEQVHYVNTYDLDALEISKELVPNDDAPPVFDEEKNVSFHYTVKFTLPAWMSDETASNALGGLPYWKGNTSEVNHAAPRPDDGDEIAKLEVLPLEPESEYVYSFTLKADETIVIYGLPIGTKYTVTEEKNPDYPAKDETYTITSEEGGIQKSPAFDGTGEPTANRVVNEAVFTNVKPKQGSLAVEKQIENDHPDTTAAFTFTVTLTAPQGGTLHPETLTATRTTGDGGSVAETLIWEPGSGPAESCTATFTLKHGEKVVISNIPYGTEYTVSETKADGYNLQRVEDGNKDSADEGKIVSHDKDTRSVTGTVLKDETAEADVSLLFVNSRAAFLPMTGGFGVWGCLGLGVLSLSLTAAVIVFRRRKRGMRAI